jgi:hypothetical protein
MTTRPFIKCSHEFTRVDDTHRYTNAIVNYTRCNYFSQSSFKELPAIVFIFDNNTTHWVYPDEDARDNDLEIVIHALTGLI